jgi:hypothetical protein
MRTRYHNRESLLCCNKYLFKYFSFGRGSCGINHPPEPAWPCEQGWAYSTPERLYLPAIRNRIENGNLAGIVRKRFEREGEIGPVLSDLAMGMRENTPYEVR